MVTKFVIDAEELDIPRGINLPREGETILLKKGGTSTTYIVDHISHIIDYSASITNGKTTIILKELKDIEDL